MGKDELDNKYMYVCRAEMNAILNKNSENVSGCTIYVALFPCNECAKMIIQSGIKSVVYYSDKHAGKASTMASKKLLSLAGVEVKQFKPRMERLVIDFSCVEGVSSSSSTNQSVEGTSSDSSNDSTDFLLVGGNSVSSNSNSVA